MMMTNKEKYKQAFNVLHASNNISYEVNRNMENGNKNLMNARKSIRYAVIACVVMLMGTMSVMAASEILKNVYLTDKSIAVGKYEYVKSGEDDESEPIVETRTKKIKYDSYEEAVKDSGNDLWFECLPGEPVEIERSYIENDFDLLEVQSYYKSYKYVVTEERFYNAVDDFGYHIRLNNKQNERTYINKNGVEFTLVDDSYPFWTDVLICYGEQYGYISFVGDMPEKYKYEILDEVIIQ